MNKDQVIQNMIKYIEDAERALQSSKLSNETKPVKTDIVNNILDKLEKEVNDEN